MKHELMKRIRNASTIEEVKDICKEAMMSNMSEDAKLAIIEQAQSKVKEF